MADAGEYDGEERRRSTPRLDAVMAEVRHLYGSVEELAVAVAHSVPRGEVEAREREHKERERQFREQAKLFLGALAAVLLILVTYSVLAVHDLKGSIADGHEVLHADAEVLVCVVKLPEGTRTDAAVLSCRQSVQAKGATP